MSDDDVTRAIRVLDRHGIRFVPIVLTAGEYSDYRIDRVFVVRSDHVKPYVDLVYKHRAERNAILDEGRILNVGYNAITEEASAAINEHDHRIRPLEFAVLRELLDDHDHCGFVERDLGSYGDEDTSLEELNLADLPWDKNGRL